MQRVKSVIMALGMGSSMLALAACGSSAPAASGGSKSTTSSSQSVSSSNPITIGWMGGLTGLLAQDAKNAELGTQMAVQQVNAKGGILGRQVKVVYEDTQTNPQLARSAAQQLILQDHVAGIVGDYYSPNVLAMEPITKQYKVPTITYDGTADAVLKQGDPYQFRSDVGNSYSAAAIGNYVMNTLHEKTFLLMGGTDAYSQNNMSDFAAYVKAHGGTVLAEKSYDPTNTKDFSPYMLPYKNAKFQGLFLGGSPADNALIIKQFRSEGFKQTIMSTTGIDRPIMPQEDGSALTGAVMAIDTPEMAVNGDSYATPTAQAWEKAWLAAGHGRLATYDGVHAYDATMLLLKAIQTAKSTSGPAVLKALLQVGKNFSGGAGNLSLSTNGAASMPQYIMQWGSDGNLHIIKEIPAGVK